MNSKSWWILVGLVTIFTIIFLYSLFGEKIPSDDKACWDGIFYQDVAKNFSSDFFSHTYDSFRIQRIFPFFLINLFGKFFSLEITDQVAMNGTLTMLVIAMILILVYFFKMAKLLEWPVQVTAILFSCIFFSHFALKNYGYEPLQTDAFALAISTVSYYYILKGKPTIAFITCLPATICWPTIPVMTLILILLRTTPSKSDDNFHLPVHKIACIAYPFIPLAFTLALQLRGSITTISTLLMSKDALWFFVVNACITGAFLYIILKPLTPIGFPTPYHLWQRLDLRLLAATALPIFAIKTFLNAFASDEFYYSSSVFFIQILLRPLKYPLVFITGHITAWGITFAIIFCKWKDFSRIFITKDLGHYFIFLLFCLFLLDSESRHLTPLLPILLYPLGEILKKTIPTAKHSFSLTTLLIVLQLGLSHFYYPINQPGFFQVIKEQNFDHPLAQRYFMNFGPWITAETYVFWTIISIFTFIIVFFALKKSQKQT